MRIDFKFRHSPMSEELTNYVSERITKLEKYEIKPFRFEFTFSNEKTCQRVDVHVRGSDIEMHAHCEADDYFTGVDMVLEKIARQLARKKDKIKNHKVPPYSKVPKAS